MDVVTPARLIPRDDCWATKGAGTAEVLTLSPVLTVRPLIVKSRLHLDWQRGHKPTTEPKPEPPPSPIAAAIPTSITYVPRTLRATMAERRAAERGA